MKYQWLENLYSGKRESYNTSGNWNDLIQIETDRHLKLDMS